MNIERRLYDSTPTPLFSETRLRFKVGHESLKLNLDSVEGLRFAVMLAIRSQSRVPLV